MSKKMLIEATHAEETRVVVVDDNARLEELDVETSTKKQIKGNIYLAKVVRVEPSLQAAFVEYGGNRHGFLAFSEIHPDYYQIPIADKESLKAELKATVGQQEEIEEEKKPNRESDVEIVSESETEDVIRPRYTILKKYKIQEVVRRNQILLVQVTKEERGNKGAALTTYLSLAGRYSVLMPNNNGGGVSRKITNAQDRRRLKLIVEDLPLSDGMAVIVRTAGKERTKIEIKRDYDYLIKTWMQIRDKTLTSKAPALIHEEGNIIKRTLRDVFSDEVEEIIIEGEDAFQMTRNFMKLLMSKQYKKVKQYVGDISLFQAYGIEDQLEEMNNPKVGLKSGGTLVIDQTEALVSIDVNSGRATRERNIEETALRTNLEAADEVARQLRLRDLAGLVVIDFIDMDEMRNNHAVERRMKDALKKDRARIQMGKITGFGLMELSRQRLHSSFLETSHHVCPYCQGKGIVRSVESSAMHAIHILEEASKQYTSQLVTLTLPTEVALYLLNAKRNNLSAIEVRAGLTIKVEGDPTMLHSTDFKLEHVPLQNIRKVELTNEGGSKLSSLKEVVQKVRNKHRNKGLDNTSLLATVPMMKVNEFSETMPVEENKKNAPVKKQGQNDDSFHKNKRKFPKNNQRDHGKEKENVSATSALGSFKVVHQEPMILFDSRQRTQNNTDSKINVVPVQSVAETSVAPSGQTVKKGGWWNKLVNS